jgi:prepilin signal peptidase PulO-like enzyme (type II secretory pathway)
MSNQKSATYNIPLRYRKMENLHIVFWLFKDVAWCMGWPPLGIAMIFPTLIISIIITWRTRQYMSELCHNVAITVWISANSYWMISEFLGFDTKLVFGHYTFKDLALIPFVTGVSILAFYYLYWKPRHKNELETL